MNAEKELENLIKLWIDFQNSSGDKNIDETWGKFQDAMDKLCEAKNFVVNE